MSSRFPKVSIIIVNWNGRHLLRNCLTAVFNQTYKNFEVILVDNASADGSVEYVKKYFPEVKIIANKKNLGWCGGNNVGIEQASGDLIVLLNPDTIVSNNWLEELVKAVMSDEKIAAACSRVIGTEKIGTINIFGFFVPIFEVPDTIKPIFHPDGCSIIFKRKYLDMPVFDSDYFMYNDEVYFGWYVHLMGYEIVYVPTSTLYHIGGGTGEKNKNYVKNIKKLKSYLNDRNRIMNICIFYEFSTLLKLFPLLLFVFLLRISLDPINRLKIISYLCKNIRTIMEKRRKIQNNRLVSDKAIFKYMTYKLIEEKSLVSKIINNIICLYCHVVGIYTLEFHGDS